MHLFNWSAAWPPSLGRPRPGTAPLTIAREARRPTRGTPEEKRKAVFITIRPNVPYIKVSSRANSSIGGTDGTSR